MTILNSSELHELMQLNPNADFTINTMNGSYEIVSKGTPPTGVDTPLGNVLFRSRVLTAIAEDLNLAEGNLFLDELCAILKIGPTAALGSAEAVLDSATLSRVLKMAAEYKLTQSQLLDTVNASEVLSRDTKLQNLIQTADRAMLRRIQYDLAAEAQMAVLKPYQRFLDSLLPQNDSTLATSNMLAMIATVPEHESGRRSDINRFLTSHRELLCQRAMALMQRDALNASKDYSKMIACTVEALDGVMKEVEILRHPVTKMDCERKTLLEQLTLRAKVMPLQELPFTVTELMRQQIVCGDQHVLTFYQESFAPGVDVTVPYPFGHGKQTLVGTERHRQCVEHGIQAVVDQVFKMAAPQAILKDECRVQIEDLHRDFEIKIGGKSLDKAATHEEVLATLTDLFDLKAHPEYTPLAAACALLAQQQGAITAFEHPLWKRQALVPFDFKSEEGGEVFGRTSVEITRVDNGFRVDLEYLVQPPKMATYHDGKDIVHELLDARNSTDFACKTQSYYVVLEEGKVRVRVTEPPKMTYQLTPLDPTLDLKTIIEDLVERPDFTERVEVSILKGVERKVLVLPKEVENVSLRSLIMEVVAHHKEAMITSAVTAFRDQQFGIPSETAMLNRCAWEIVTALEHGMFREP